MAQISKRILDKNKQERIFRLLIDCIKTTRKQTDTNDFLHDLFTPTERIMMAKRLAIAVLLLRDDYTQKEISKYLNVSNSTVNRINQSLKFKGDGMRLILGKVTKKKEFINLLKEIYLDMSTIKGKGKNWSRIGKKKYQVKSELEKPF